ncbi:MAG: hypothetical protein US96_C0003G0002 [Candidatus Woesebacteria bacterium GW2011_GWB1_38_5b]|uniref:Aminoglycoside phosphotransferase domain-containing protein n=1 Tax=Candidatus Woesebacteria bacterium GW2011_GWB1_38_5b TaxID=1618569 RepID=A0A0G0MQ93_9BACT|nr:MAG: hypothetical protein US96_C0003G0002 [Candidatus Woesebacteria bacterium GW2011_GWB1_38_5b]
MNKCFVDTRQNLVIKVLDNISKAQREIVGIREFSDIALVPQIELLDTKTISITLVDSMKSTQIPDFELTQLILQLLRKVNSFETKINKNYNIQKRIEYLVSMFKSSECVVQTLNEIQALVSKAKLFPVHGDLQKQNIFVNSNELQLIDFEHFLFAPLELDIVNSLFFNDSNCLDAKFIISQLIKEKIFSEKMIISMLKFYAINQLAEGRKKEDVTKRLNKGLSKLDRITKSWMDTSMVNL